MTRCESYPPCFGTIYFPTAPFFYLISESLNITDCIDRLGYVCDLVTGKTFHNVLIYARFFRHRNECCSGIVRPMFGTKVQCGNDLVKTPSGCCIISRDMGSIGSISFDLHCEIK